MFLSLILLCCFGLIFLVCFIFSCWFVILELKIRGQRLRRFPPSPEGYYEAFLTDEGFIKPDDNVSLDVPYNYSPHIAMQQQKENGQQPQSDDAVVVELYEKGLSMNAIAKATGRPYSQIQKITRTKREG